MLGNGSISSADAPRLDSSRKDGNVLRNQRAQDALLDLTVALDISNQSMKPRRIANLLFQTKHPSCRMPRSRW